MVTQYVEAVQTELLSLQEQQATLELKLMAANNRIKILEKKRTRTLPPKPDDMRDVARRIAFILASAGMKIVDAKGRYAKRKPAARRRDLASSTRSRVKRAPG